MTRGPAVNDRRRGEVPSAQARTVAILRTLEENFAGLSAAALAEGRRVILVERDPRFAEIARQRCAHATPDLTAPVRVPARAATPAPAADPRQRSLFDLLAEGAR